MSTMTQTMTESGLCIVIGASGGVGGALADALEAQRGAASVLRLGRASAPRLDLTDEASVQEAARHAGEAGRALGGLSLVIDATGFLHDERFEPEKSLRQLDPAHMAHAFALNAIGPALLMKHFLPLAPRSGRFVFATLSARVGSIGDNHLGGWYSYRASKAALNQLVRTAAVELARTRPDAVCVALHPGTVDTKLSAPFARSGLNVRPPAIAAADILRVIAGLSPAQSGGFFDHKGDVVPW